VILNKDVWLNIVSEDGDEIKIVIEDNCAIGRRNTITAKNCIHIEKNVISGPGVLIQDHAHAFEDTNLPVREQGVTSGGIIRIEEGCWIGQGAAIICNKGELVIGRNSVIGANAVVTKTFPPYSVIVGIPGRLARLFDLARGTWVRCKRSGTCE
jgi:acetyltransferase-like isoleucine patch superfamily enzyme